MDIIGLITARGGSKGIPQKNIKMLAGKPLIAWTIEAALQSKQFKRLFVSTDDVEIARVAGQWGAELPFLRPPELALDDTPHFAVVEHALRWLEGNLNLKPYYLMLLQPTSPLRTAGDIAAAAEIAANYQAEAVVSLCAMEPHPFLAKTLFSDGTFADFLSHDIAYPRRQDLPQVYALNGAIYLNRRESLLKTKTFCPPGAYAYVMPAERSLDIDSPWDFRLAELILKDQYGTKPH